METFLLLLLIYLASVFSVYKWVQLAFYHIDGKFNASKPDAMEIFFCFMPIINTGAGVLFWMIMWPINYSNKTNFFKPKNK